MEDNKYNVDIVKEALMVLSFCEDDVLDRIPNNVLINMNDMAALSNKEYYFEKDKSLLEQNISDECHKLLSELYFMYMDNM